MVRIYNSLTREPFEARLDLAPFRAAVSAQIQQATALFLPGGAFLVSGEVEQRLIESNSLDCDTAAHPYLRGTR